MSIDEIRARLPHLGFALYAMEPGGPVTLEVYSADGDVFTFAGPSAAAVLERAFPAPPPLPEPDPEPQPNIFD